MEFMHSFRLSLYHFIQVLCTLSCISEHVIFTLAGKTIIVYAYQFVIFTTLQHVQLVTMVYIVNHVDTVEGVKGVILWLVTVVRDVNLIGRCPSVKVGKEQGSHYNPTMKIM